MGSNVLTEYKTRAAVIDDAQTLGDLAVRSKSYWGYTQDFLERCRPHLKVDEGYIRDWPVKVLEMDGHIAGFYSLKNIKDEDRLDNLWIDLPYIGKGFGRIMLLHAIDTARGLGWVTFRLAADKCGQTFYEKFGGRVIGTVQSRLGADIFLIHMEFSLHSESLHNL